MQRQDPPTCVAFDCSAAALQSKAGSPAACAQRVEVTALRYLQSVAPFSAHAIDNEVAASIGATDTGR